MNPSQPLRISLYSSPFNEEARLLSGLGWTARPLILEARRNITDHFRGLYLKGRLTVQKLESVLQCLPDGLTELMVHPGRVIGNLPKTPFSSFSTVEREQELETLLNAKLRLILKEMKIILTPFPETPC